MNEKDFRKIEKYILFQINWNDKKASELIKKGVEYPPNTSTPQFYNGRINAFEDILLKIRDFIDEEDKK